MVLPAIRGNRRYLAAGTVLLAAVAVGVYFSWGDEESGSPSNSAPDWAGPVSDRKSGCEVRALAGAKGYKDGKVIDVSSSGKYLVGKSGGDDVLWRNAKATKFAEGFSVEAVNSSGVAVGVDEAGEDALIYRHGKLSKLELPKPDKNQAPNKGSYEVQIVGINDDGDVTGFTNVTKGGHRDAENPLVWKAGSTKPTELSLDAGKTGVPTEINEDGTIFGGSDVQTWYWDSKGSRHKLRDRKDYNPDGTVVASAGDWTLLVDGKWKTSQKYDPKKTELFDAGSTNIIDGDGRVYGGTYDLVLDEQNLESPVREDSDGIIELPSPAKGGIGPRDDLLAGASDDGSVIGGTMTRQVGDVHSEKDDKNFPTMWKCDTHR